MICQSWASSIWLARDWQVMFIAFLALVILTQSSRRFTDPLFESATNGGSWSGFVFGFNTNTRSVSCCSGSPIGCWLYSGILCKVVLLLVHNVSVIVLYFPLLIWQICWPTTCIFSDFIHTICKWICYPIFCPGSCIFICFFSVIRRSCNRDLFLYS